MMLLENSKQQWGGKLIYWLDSKNKESIRSAIVTSTKHPKWDRENFSPNLAIVKGGMVDGKEII